MIEAADLSTHPSLNNLTSISIQVAGSVATSSIMMSGLTKRLMIAGATKASFRISGGASIILTQTQTQNSMGSMGRCIHHL